MIYQKTISTPANTSIAGALKTTIELTKGLIYKVEVYIPPGSCGLMGCAILEKNVWLYPSNRDEYFTGDAVQIEYEDTYLLSMPPYEVDILTYNLDSYFAHSVIVRIGLLSRDDLIVRYLPKNDIDKLIAYLDENQSKITGEKVDYSQFLRTLTG